MKKTIKLTEKDLTRIVKRVVNEQKNVLFPDSSMKANQGWERRRSEKGAKMSGEIYHDIKNDIRKFEEKINRVNIRYYDHFAYKEISTIYGKIRDVKNDKSLPKNKIDDLEKEFIGICEKLFDDIEMAYKMIKSFFPNRGR